MKLFIVARDSADVAALALDSHFGDVEITGVSLGKRPRDAIRQAARSGAEILHVVADGSTLSSWDGILEIDDDEPIPASELNAVIRGSRITLVGLSPSKQARASEGSRHGPTVFRAFSHVAADLEEANVVAQLGPWDHQHTLPLFRVLYTEAANSNSVETGVLRVRKQIPHVPLALFLRQRLGREFTKKSRSPTSGLESIGSGTEEPEAVAAQTQLTRDLLGALESVEQRYKNLKEPLTGSVAAREERSRTDAREAVIAPWTSLDEDEK